MNATDFDLRDGDAVVARVRDWGGARRPVKDKSDPGGRIHFRAGR